MVHSKCYKYKWKDCYWFERNYKILHFGTSTSLFNQSSLKKYHFTTFSDLPNSGFLDISNKLAKMPPTFPLLPRCYQMGPNKLRIEFDISMFYLKTLSLYSNRYVTKSILRPSSEKRIFTSLLHAHTLHSSCTAKWVYNIVKYSALLICWLWNVQVLLVSHLPLHCSLTV